MSRTAIWLLAPLPSRALTKNVRPPADTATGAAASTLPAPLMVKLGSDKVKVADFLRQSETSTGSRRGEEKRRGAGGGEGVIYQRKSAELMVEVTAATNL